VKSERGRWGGLHKRETESPKKSAAVSRTGKDQACPNQGGVVEGEEIHRNPQDSRLLGLRGRGLQLLNGGKISKAVSDGVNVDPLRWTWGRTWTSGCPCGRSSFEEASRS